MLEYVQISPGGEFPDVSEYKPYRAVVIIEDSVTKQWRIDAADWLCLSGCLYMLAWGDNCGLWDDYVDQSSVILEIDGSLPKDHFIITTWHEKETLEEVFEFSKEWANYPGVVIENTLLIHISQKNKREELFALYRVV